MESVYVVEFFHAHFGWLDYDHEFESLIAARDWMNSHPSPYRQRVRKLLVTATA